MKFVDISKVPAVTHELKYINSKIGPVVTIVEENSEHIEKLRKWLAITCDVRMTPMSFDRKIIIHIECHQEEKETIEYFVEITDKVASLIFSNHYFAICSPAGEILLLSEVTCEDFIRTAMFAKEFAKFLGFDDEYFKKLLQGRYKK